MIALIPAIALSSLVGSLHCLAMCGPLAGVGGARGVRLALVHALGRLVTYATLGAIAGAIGKALELAGELAAIQRAATLLAGLVVLGWGGYQLAIATGRWRARAEGGAAFRAGLVRIRARRPALRAWLAGVLTGLLPCGWLWAFVVAAAGTGGPATGALAMTAFWLGTLPAMIGAPALLGPAIRWLRARMPVVTAVAVMALGLGTLAVRWTDGGAAQVSHPHCHGGAR